VISAGLGWKQCGEGAGWEGVRAGCGLEVYGCGAGKISQILAGSGWDRTKNG